MASQARQAKPAPAAGDDHPLRRLRRRRGLTQVELAGLAGLSYSYISMVERGHRTAARRERTRSSCPSLGNGRTGQDG
jgi:DNA-binding XRE family transcriptional regulator